MSTCYVLRKTQEHKKSPAPGESGAPAHATSDPDNIGGSMERETGKSRVHTYVGNFHQSLKKCP